MIGFFYSHRLNFGLNQVRQRLRESMEYALGKAKSFLRREDGTIAIEFAMLSPLLVIGVLSLGLYAVHLQRRMDIEQIVRIAAEEVVNDPGADVVWRRMAQASIAKGYGAISPWDDRPRQEGELALFVGRNCFCPEGGDQDARDCRSVCIGGRPTGVRYILSAQEDVPQFDFWFFNALADLNGASWLPAIRIQKMVMAR